MSPVLPVKNALAPSGPDGACLHWSAELVAQTGSCSSSQKHSKVCLPLNTFSHVMTARLVYFHRWIWANNGGGLSAHKHIVWSWSRRINSVSFLLRALSPSKQWKQNKRGLTMLWSRGGSSELLSSVWINWRFTQMTWPTAEWCLKVFFLPFVESHCRKHVWLNEHCWKHVG